MSRECIGILRFVGRSRSKQPALFPTVMAIQPGFWPEHQGRAWATSNYCKTAHTCGGCVTNINNRVDTSHLQQSFTMHPRSPVLERHLKGERKIVGVTAPQIVADTSLSSSAGTQQRWEIVEQNPMICQNPTNTIIIIISIICTTDNKAQIFLCKNEGSQEQLAAIWPVLQSDT